MQQVRRGHQARVRDRAHRPRVAAPAGPHRGRLLRRRSRRCNQLAQVSATEARLLTITPYDKNSIKAIEKAILESDVGLTPSNDGKVIRLPIPELTEERRKELVKVVHGIAEQGRVAVRNVRRDVMHDLRELKSEGEVGADDERRAEAELQKLTDAHVGEIDTALAGKEEEILEV